MFAPTARKCTLTRSALALMLVLTISISTSAATRGERSPGPAAADLLSRAFPGETLDRPRDGGALFSRVLATDLFASASVGPFDVHVFVADALHDRRKASRLLDELVETLAPAADLVTRLWPEGDGLISAARLPIVIADSAPENPGYVSLVELLDYCERLGFSGWLPANKVDISANRGAEVVRTWDVQLFNMGHKTISERRARWVDHGVGYYTLAFVANRALRRGAWGLVPPWLATGLIDELDISAYGQAWVGQESWVRQTPGWHRAGWSGFVPQGAAPPAALMGPPANLAVTVSKTGDAWLDFDASETRHWSDLISDRKTEAPASFTRAAESESFLPRDRAAGRCLLHLLLEVPAGGESFTSLLDSEVKTPRDGMPDSEPLSVLFARAMGGVSEVDRLEGLSTLDLLKELGRTDLIDLFSRVGAEPALEMTDHRSQSAWLFGQSQFDTATRGQLFNAFLETEHEQQMAEWKALAPHLDGGLAAALKSSRRFPSRARDIAKVSDAFRSGLAEDPTADTRSVSGRRSRRSRR
jgi:hypothetical protein